MQSKNLGWFGDLHVAILSTGDLQVALSVDGQDALRTWIEQDEYLYPDFFEVLHALVCDVCQGPFWAVENEQNGHRVFYLELPDEGLWGYREFDCYPVDELAEKGVLTFARC